MLRILGELCSPHHHEITASVLLFLIVLQKFIFICLFLSSNFPFRKTSILEITNILKALFSHLLYSFYNPITHTHKRQPLPSSFFSIKLCNKNYQFQWEIFNWKVLWWQIFSYLYDRRESWKMEALFGSVVNVVWTVRPSTRLNTLGFKI